MKDGARHAFEGGVVVAILAIALAGWFGGNVVRPLSAPSDGPAGAARYGKRTTQELFASLRERGEGTALLVAGGALLLTGVGCAVGLGVAAARRGRAGLRESWQKRTDGLGDEGPTIVQAFLAFAVMTFAVWPAQTLAPRGTLEPVELERAGGATGATPEPVPLLGLELGGAKGLALPGVPERRATVGPGGRLVVWPGDAPLRVDGVAPATSTLDLRDGAQVEVGGHRLTWRAADAAAVARYHVVSGLVQAGALLLVIWPLFGRDALRRVGLVATGLPAELRRGLVGWLATLPLYLLVVAAWQALGEAIGLPSPNHPTIGVLERGGLPVAALLLVQVTLLAPLGEELLFRGMVLPAFARVLGPLAAVLASALLFGAVHPYFASLAPIGLLGLLFAGLYATSPSRSLVGSIVAHALHNGTTLGVAVAIQAATRP